MIFIEIKVLPYKIFFFFILRIKKELGGIILEFSQVFSQNWWFWQSSVISDHFTITHNHDRQKMEKNDLRSLMIMI